MCDICDRSLPIVRRCLKYYATYIYGGINKGTLYAIRYSVLYMSLIYEHANVVPNTPIQLRLNSNDLNPIMPAFTAL